MGHIPFGYHQAEEAGKKLKDNVYPDRFFQWENFEESDNPLEGLIAPPGIDEFFGTKVCNIFVISKPYGWKFEGSSYVDHWPPEGLEESKARHKELFHKFAKYETHIWVNYEFVTISESLDPSANSKIRVMLNGTKGHFVTLCDELKDYGFTLHDDLQSGQVKPEAFQDVLDAFYGID